MDQLSGLFHRINRHAEGDSTPLGLWQIGQDSFVNLRALSVFVVICLNEITPFNPPPSCRRTILDMNVHLRERNDDAILAELAIDDASDIALDLVDAKDVLAEEQQLEIQG